MKFSLNGEFLCFTLLFNFVKKFLCQTLRRRANLRKTDLIRGTTYQFAHFTNSIRASAYRYVERRWYVLLSSLPDCQASCLTRWYNKPRDITKDFKKRLFTGDRTFHGLKITNCNKTLIVVKQSWGILEVGR